MRRFLIIAGLVSFLGQPTVQSADPVRKIASVDEAESLSPEARAVLTLYKEFGSGQRFRVKEAVERDLNEMDFQTARFYREKLAGIPAELLAEAEKISATRIRFRIESQEWTLETVSLKERKFKVNGRLVTWSKNQDNEKMFQTIKKILNQPRRTVEGDKGLESSFAQRWLDSAFGFLVPRAEAQDFLSIILGIAGPMLTQYSQQQQQSQQNCMQIAQAASICTFAINDCAPDGWQCSHRGLDTALGAMGLAMNPPQPSFCGSTKSQLAACLSVARQIKENPCGHRDCSKPPPGLVLGFPQCPCGAGTAGPPTMRADQGILSRLLSSPPAATRASPLQRRTSGRQ